MYYAGPPQEIRQARPAVCGGAPVMWPHMSCLPKIGRGGPVMLLNIYSIPSIINRTRVVEQDVVLHSEHNKC